MKYIERRGKKYRYYNEADLIKEVAKITDVVPEDVKMIHHAFEEVMVKHLMEADEESDIEVEYIKGIRIISKFVKGHYMRHPSAGKMMTTFVPTRVTFSARFTEWYREKRVAEYRKGREIFDEWAKVSDANWEKDRGGWFEKAKEKHYAEIREQNKKDLAALKEMELEYNRDDDVTAAE